MHEQRKVVTALFCDLSESTALGEQLDPEALRALLARYFQEMRAIVERHGGSVEKFIGDAVMAVFGVPLLHEDDALRACRAALEMLDALPALGIQGRIGVNSGEVVAGTEERLATGDALNVAARLQQAAQPGEVLIGAPTFELVRSTVVAEPAEPLRVRGKADDVPVYRLIAVGDDAAPRFAGRMVGRERELRELHDAFARAVHDRSCQLFTVLGSAGVGKSRLAAEFLAGLDAHVVRGRCASYGEGVGYLPALEMLEQLEHLPEGDAARPLRSLLGETEEPASAEEIAWGFRKLLEQEAQAQPLVCVFDDLHWAADALLDLVERISELSRDAPILVLCLARPELLELRPSWGGGKWNATTVLLEPLDAAETEQLLAELGGAPPDLRAQILHVAEGNPLFVEEMLALIHSSGRADVRVPPTIRALLAARLDQLPADERAVLERGSVEGRIFHRGAVAALLDGPEEIDERLVGLVRKELVRPDRPQFPNEDAYRFRHLLIRDAAYDALPKAVRAELHRRFAAWLEEHGRLLVELDEILGYHLEQAAHYLEELGRPDADLAVRAGDRLAAAGRRALWRVDRPTAAILLERALTLTRPFRFDVHLEVDLAYAVAWAGPQPGRTIADAAARRAHEEGDEAGEALARVIAVHFRALAGEVGVAEVETVARAALPLLEQVQDHAGLARVWQVLGGNVANQRGCWEEAAEALERRLHHARLAGQRHPSLFLDAALALHYGPRPAGEVLAQIDDLLREYPHPIMLLHRARVLAMLGRSDEARRITPGAFEEARELGAAVSADLMVGQAEVLAGDHAAAAERFERACRLLREQRDMAYLASSAPMLGRELCALGRHDEAEHCARLGREAAGPGDVSAEMFWRQVQALVDAHRGQYEDAELLAREAVELGEQTDALNWQGDALADLADVLETAGRPGDAAQALEDALDRYRRKQNLAMVAQVLPRLEQLRSGVTA